MPVSIADLRLENITSLSSWQVNRLSISAPDMVLEASKSGGDWFLHQPEDGEADYDATSDLLRSIVETQVAEYIDPASAPASLEEPEIIITLDSDYLTEELLFSKAEDEQMYFGKRANPDEFFKVNASALESILNNAGSIQIVPAENDEAEAGEEDGENVNLGGNSADSNE